MVQQGQRKTVSKLGSTQSAEANCQSPAEAPCDFGPQGLVFQQYCKMPADLLLTLRVGGALERQLQPGKQMVFRRALSGQTSNVALVTGRWNPIRGGSVRPNQHAGL